MKLGNQVTKVSSPLKELVWPLSGSQAISISYRETCRRSVESGTMTALQLSPDDFRRIAKQVTDLAAEYLESMDSRPISPQATGADTERLFRSVLPEEGAGEEVWKELQPVIQHSRAQNGRFFGYVLGSGEPLGAMADLLASILNQNVTAWRSGPATRTATSAARCGVPT